MCFRLIPVSSIVLTFGENCLAWDESRLRLEKGGRGAGSAPPDRPQAPPSRETPGQGRAVGSDQGTWRRPRLP